MVRWNPVKFGDLWNHKVIGGIVREYLWYCGELWECLRISDMLRNPQGVFAQTRQGSEETLRISHLTHLRLRPRSQQTTSSKLEPCLPLRVKSTSWTFGPIRGLLRAFQHLMSQKPYGFASFRRCQLAGGGAWGLGGSGALWCWVCVRVMGWVCDGVGDIQPTNRLWGWVYGVSVHPTHKQALGIGRKSIRAFTTKIPVNPHYYKVFLYIHYNTFLRNFNRLASNSWRIFWLVIY